jgi:hypothetical protein
LDMDAPLGLVPVCKGADGDHGIVRHYGSISDYRSHGSPRRQLRSGGAWVSALLPVHHDP